MTTLLIPAVLALLVTAAWAAWVRGDLDAPSFTKFVQTVFERGRARTLAGILRKSSQRPAVRLWLGLVEHAEQLAGEGAKDPKLVHDELDATRRAWTGTLRPGWMTPALLAVAIAAPAAAAARAPEANWMALAVAVTALTLWGYGVALSRRRRFELLEEIPQIVDLVAAQVQRGWVTAPVAPLPPAIQAPSPARPAVEPREPSVVPRPCLACQHAEFARGDLVAIRALGDVARAGDLPHHDCEALICLGCGRIEWFVKDPEGLVEGERPRLKPMTRVRARG